MFQIDLKSFFVGGTALLANNSIPEIFHMITPQDFAYYIQAVTSLIIAVATLIKMIKIKPKNIKDDSITPIITNEPKQAKTKSKSPLNNK
jgi:hypothetical protein